MASNIDTSDFMSRQGISLSTYSSAGYADSKISSMIDSAVQMGANYVVLGNVNLVDLRTNTISDVIENGLNQTAPLADVGKAIDQAQRAGLNVVLKPQLAVIDPAYDQYNSASWINMVNPDLTISDPAAFFRSYKAMLLEWGALAQSHGVDTLTIGNEMVAATKPEYTAYWLDLIADLRKVYDGKLTYAALAPVIADAAVNEITQIGFWDKLDYAGFDVFPSLTHETDPTVEQLKQGWYDATVYGHRQNYVEFLTEMAAHVGKPVVFAETGLPSFDGASDREATSDGMIGTGVRADDQQEQADWWQAFFEVWSEEAPAWLKGIYAINNDPGDLGSYYHQNYNINGKLAEKVVAAWFDGRTELGETATALTGSAGDDHLFLYDPDRPRGGKGLADNLETVIEVVVTGSLIDGTAPVIRAIVNGFDFGPRLIAARDSGYVSPDGTHFTINSTFTFKLPGLVNVDELKLVFASPETVNGASATAFFHSVSVNGVALQTGQYYPSEGRGGPYEARLPSEGDGGSSGQWAGGYTVFDASQWNAWLASDTRGTAATPFDVQGGDGYDVLHVLGKQSDYTVTKTGEGIFKLTDKAGLRQSASLAGIEKIAFADGSETDLVAKPVEPPVNHAPVLVHSITDQTLAAHTAWTLQVGGRTFADSDGDLLSYVASLAGGDPLPAWLTFDPATRTFAGTPPQGVSGAIELVVTASDGRLSVSDDFKLVIAPEVMPPLSSGGAAGWRLFTSNGWRGEIAGSGTVHGTNDAEDITILDFSGRVEFDPSFNRGGDTIHLHGAASDWWVQQFGSAVILANAKSSVVIPAGVTGIRIGFDTGFLELRYDKQLGQLLIGDQVVDGELHILAAEPQASAFARAALDTIDGDSAARAHLFLGNGAAATIDGNVTVFGTIAAEEVMVTHGSVYHDPSFNRGNDTVVFSEASGAFEASVNGASITLSSALSDLSVPVGTAGLALQFTDIAATLIYDEQAYRLLIGDQEVLGSGIPLQLG